MNWLIMVMIIHKIWDFIDNKIDFINTNALNFCMWFRKKLNLKFPHRLTVEYYLKFLFDKFVSDYTTLDLSKKAHREAYLRMLEMLQSVSKKRFSKFDPDIYIVEDEELWDEEGEVRDEHVYWYVYMDLLEDFMEYFKAFYLYWVDVNKKEDAKKYYLNIMRIFTAVHKHMSKNQLDYEFFFIEMLDLEKQLNPILEDNNFFEYMGDVVDDYLGMYEYYYDNKMYDTSMITKENIYLFLMEAVNIIKDIWNSAINVLIECLAFIYFLYDRFIGIIIYICIFEMLIKNKIKKFWRNLFKK